MMLFENVHMNITGQSRVLERPLQADAMAGLSFQPVIIEADSHELGIPRKTLFRASGRKSHMSLVVKIVLFRRPARRKFALFPGRAGYR